MKVAFLFAILILASSFGKVRGIHDQFLHGKWRVVKKEEMKGQEWSNSTVKECDKDDQLVIAPTGSLKIDIGSVHCKEREINIEGTWKLTNEVNLTFTIKGIAFTQTVIKLTKDTLVLQLPRHGGPLKRTTFTKK